MAILRTSADLSSESAITNREAWAELRTTLKARRAAAAEGGPERRGSGISRAASCSRVTG